MPRIATAGIDTQIDWRFDVGPGELALNFVPRTSGASRSRACKVNRISTTRARSAQVDPFTLSYPERKLTSSASYSIGPASVMVCGRYYDSMLRASDVGVANPTRPGVESREYFDLAAQYEIATGLKLRAGVVNLLDTEPPEWTTGSLADPALYDIIQRRYYLGINKQF